MTSRVPLIMLPLCLPFLTLSALADASDLCSVRMMTYNIQAARHLYPAAQGLELIARTIEAAGKPDVLMLQEVMRFDPYVDYIDEFQWLKDRLGYSYGYFTSGQQDPVSPGSPEWGNAIYLGDGIGTVTGSQKYRIGWNRSLCRVTVSIRGLTIHYFNTHTGSGAIAEQVESIAGIIDDYTALQQPVILGGDFNEIATGAAMSPIRQILEDAFIKVSSPLSSIDTFYVSPQVTVHDVFVQSDPTHASDHDPVVCRVSPWPVLAGPSITQHPEAQDRCAGDTVVFSVAATGTGPLSYQWQKDQPNEARITLADNERVNGATTSTLTLSDIQNTDIGQYRCVVTDAQCSRASESALLTLVPTAIVTPPSAQSVGIGGTAGFTVVAKGAGTLSYKWQKNGADLVDDGRIVGAKLPTLRIAPCGPNDAGDYRCVVSGYCGTATTSPAALTVLPMPPINFYENWDSYAEGSSDPAYISRWVGIAGTSRHDIWVGNYDEFSPPNSAKVRLLQALGISHPLAAELIAAVPGADRVYGMDDSPLELLVKLYLQYTNLSTADVFAELSKGDVHAPAGASATVQPVIAFGFTAGMHGSARYPRFFDGKNWTHVTALSTNGGHNDFKMSVRTSSVVLQGLRVATGSATLSRLYLGGFDRLSLRTANNVDKARSISDVSLTGGAIAGPLTVNAGADKEIPVSGQVVLCGTVSGGMPPYVAEWSPAGGLSNPHVFSPTASPTVTTVYTLTVTDSWGESASDSVVVTLAQPVPCDFDGDGDVDQEDFGLLQACLGETGASQHPTCWLGDLDDSGTISANDVILFIGCMTGPGYPGDANCPP